MKKAVAFPQPSMGVTVVGLSETVPNQSMRLQDILQRFTRGEVLNVGKTVAFVDSEEDLEKIQHMDLVDREEFLLRLQRIEKSHQDAAEKKKKEAAAKADADAREKAKAEMREELRKEFEEKGKVNS